MGSKSAGPGGQQGGDVPAFDMPPMQRTYTPEEWSKTFGPNVEPDPRVIRQGPQTGGPMMPFQPGPQGIGGQGTPPQMSNDDYLRMMYQTQLGRAPDQGGMDYWRNQLASGAVNRDQLQNDFRSSAEGQGYQQRMRPMMDDFGYGRPQMSPEVLDALRLAQQRQQETPTYDPRVVQQQNPSVSQALALLGRLFG